MSASINAMTAAHCTPFMLPSNGVLSLANSAITLTTNVIFQPRCTGGPPQAIAQDLGTKYPFYASAVPQVYVIAASTIIAWVLLVMLMITVRTSLPGTAAAPVGFSSRHGMIGGATGGSSNLVGIGSRPWLQKVAAFTAALGLTLASAKLLQESALQYSRNYEDSDTLRVAVLNSTEIRVMRLVSDIFLWLAQVQTLIRLFPRHKEKVLIKWIGFALILCDAVFACLNVTLVNDDTSGEYGDAISALLYLFEFALSLLYSAWVIYYSLTKRRYAYYHPKMKGVSLIALLSLIAVLTPAVFFVTDVSNPDIAGWGDYTRWVGAAAASVVVWEWVERIEALEREERKDGILGRELFDGDEMLDVMPSDDVVWSAPRGRRSRLRRQNNNDDVSDEEGGDLQPSVFEKGLNGLTSRLRDRRKPIRPHFPMGRAHSSLPIEQSAAETRQQAVDGANQSASISFGALPKPSGRMSSEAIGHPTYPPVVASPVSRTNTTSAASTVYVVRYHGSTDAPRSIQYQPGVRVNTAGNDTAHESSSPGEQQSGRSDLQSAASRDPEKGPYEIDEVSAGQQSDRWIIPAWMAVRNPFKRKRSGLPREVQAAAASNRDDGFQSRLHTPAAAQSSSRWDFGARLGIFAADTGERLRDHGTAIATPQQNEPSVTVIPAPPRGSGRVWTPDQHLTEKDSSPENSSASSSETHGLSGTTVAVTPERSTTVLSQTVPTRSRTDPPPGARSDSSARSLPSDGRRSAMSRASDVVRPESLTPDRSGNSPVIIPAPSRSRKNRSPLATHNEASDPVEGD